MTVGFFFTLDLAFCFALETHSLPREGGRCKKHSITGLISVGIGDRPTYSSEPPTSKGTAAAGPCSVDSSKENLGRLFTLQQQTDICQSHT